MGFIVGGFCVGFGTKLGNGCTSGHGICGLARFSKRSLMAVLTFMTTGIISTTLFPADAFATTENYLVTQNTLCCGSAGTLLSVVLELPGLLGYVPPMSINEFSLARIGRRYQPSFLGHFSPWLVYLWHDKFEQNRRFPECDGHPRWIVGSDTGLCHGRRLAC